jgi:hypothetical protein
MRNSQQDLTDIFLILCLPRICPPPAQAFFWENFLNRPWGGSKFLKPTNRSLNRPKSTFESAIMMSEEAEVPKAVRGPFKDRKALLAALLLRDSPTADIRPSSKVNNKQRVRYDCGTPGCKVLPFFCCALFHL